MVARFLLDEHISPSVARGCRKRAVDVLSLGEAGLLGAADADILRAAIQLGRILVTYDTGDFARLFADFLKEGLPIWGVVFVDGHRLPPSDIGGLVGALVRLARRIDAGDVDPTGGLFLTV